MCDRVLCYMLEDDARVQAFLVEGMRQGYYDTCLRLAAAWSLQYKLPRSMAAAKALTAVLMEMAPEVDLHPHHVLDFVACLTVADDETLLRRMAGKVMCLRHQKRPDAPTYGLTDNLLADYVLAGEALSLAQLKRILLNDDLFARDVCDYVLGGSINTDSDKKAS